MKQFLVNIPDNQVAAFTKYAQEHHFDLITSNVDFEVPEFHKIIVKERIKNSNPATLLDLKEVKNKIRNRFQ